MEIGPILRIHAVSSVKPAGNGPQLSAVFEIKNVIGPRQDTLSHSENKMPGGQDDSIVEEAPTELSAETLDSDSDSTVSFFA